MKLYQNSALDKYVEQFFIADPKFNKKVCLELSQHHGIGINRAYIKVDLPELPSLTTFGAYNIEYKYKDFIIYDLIKCIEIVIDEVFNIKYNSEILQTIDYMYENEKQVQYLGQLHNNQIYYPINLNQIFSRSESLTTNDTSDLPLDYHGIRLCDAKYLNIRFFVTFGSLHDIVNIYHPHDNSYECCYKGPPAEIYDKAIQLIKDLEIRHASMIFNYTQSLAVNKISPILSPIYQTITYWIHDEIYHEIIKDMTNLEIKLHPTPHKIKYLNSITDIIFTPESFSTMKITQNVIKYNNKECYDAGTSQLLRLEYEYSHFPIVSEDDNYLMYTFKKNAYGYKMNIFDFDKTKDNLILYLWFDKYKYDKGYCKIDYYYKVTQIIAYDRNDKLHFVNKYFQKVE